MLTFEVRLIQPENIPHLKFICILNICANNNMNGSNRLWIQSTLNHSFKAISKFNRSNNVYLNTFNNWIFLNKFGWWTLQNLIFVCTKHTEIQIKLVLKSKSCEYEFELFKAFKVFTNAATKRLLENYVELKDVCSIYESVNGNLFL